MHKTGYIKTNKKNEENWVDELMERQENDIEAEEEILSSVPNRIKHKFLEEDS